IGGRILPRRTAAAFAVLLGIAVFAPRVGEPDRTEASVISVLRAIVSGEKTYASMNGGYYETLACLAHPSRGPGPRSTPQIYLAPELAAVKERRGYRFEFHEGPRGRPLDSAPSRSESAASRSGLTSFAVVAVPVNLGAGKRRLFCTDDRQLIYVTPEPSIPR